VGRWETQDGVDLLFDTTLQKAELCEALVEALAEAFPGSSLLGDAPAGAPADAPRDLPKCPEFPRRLAQGGSWWPISAPARANAFLPSPLASPRCFASEARLGMSRGFGAFSPAFLKAAETAWRRPEGRLQSRPLKLVDDVFLRGFGD